MTGAIWPALFILPWDPQTPPPSPDPGGPRCPLRLSLLSQFKYFRGAFGALHNFYSSPLLLILLCLGGKKKKVASQLAQAASSAVEKVNNGGNKKRKVYGEKKERKGKEKSDWLSRGQPVCVSPAVDQSTVDGLPQA